MCSESYIPQHIETQPTSTVSFAWQGGEPTLLGIDFFRNVVGLQAKWANGKKIENALQTNGILLDDSWGRFFCRQPLPRRNLDRRSKEISRYLVISPNYMISSPIPKR